MNIKIADKEKWRKWENKILKKNMRTYVICLHAPKVKSIVYINTKDEHC